MSAQVDNTSSETSTQDDTNMAGSVRHNLKIISDKVRVAYMEAPVPTRAKNPPRLVAVSKTKPKEMILEAYAAGHRHFGENYVQELEEKSNDPEIIKHCPDIKWHFIGNCQTKNVTKLAKSKNISVIETITSVKLADKIQAQYAKKNKDESLVNVMIQVNTSGEENKNGIEPGSDTLSAVKHIKDKCPNLNIIGLMTIGALGHSLASSVQAENGQNPDFLKLIQCRKDVATVLEVEDNCLELSMGMSNDFVEAIAMGSTNVRVGSSIFGARNYPNKPSVNEAKKNPENESNSVPVSSQIASAHDNLSKLSLNN